MNDLLIKAKYDLFNSWYLRLKQAYWELITLKSPILATHRLLNLLVNELRSKGLWVERHSYSFRVMHRNAIVASFHVYPYHKEIHVKLYSGVDEIDFFVMRVLEETFIKILSDYKIHFSIIPRWL